MDVARTANEWYRGALASVSIPWLRLRPQRYLDRKLAVDQVDLVKAIVAAGVLVLDERRKAGLRPDRFGLPGQMRGRGIVHRAPVAFLNTRPPCAAGIGDLRLERVVVAVERVERQFGCGRRRSARKQHTTVDNGRRSLRRGVSGRLRLRQAQWRGCT